MKTRKLWLGLGAAALTSTFPAQTPHAAVSTVAIDAVTQAARCASQLRVQLAENQAPHAHGGATKTDAGGEGGEGSAAKTGADERLDPMVRFYRDIQLVRGHLLVGDELIKAGKWADALPHFLHPVEELYGDRKSVV